MATDDQEMNDIRFYFGRNAVVNVIGNVPRPPLREAPPEKRAGELRLVYLSLIASKKNLALVLACLKHITTPVVFDIYGPIKDEAYWQACQSLMRDQIHSINYRGILSPHDVHAVLTKYHAFVLLSKGENFGHAIYEALSVGIPAILSKHTPWKMLQDHNAGLSVDIENQHECSEAIEKILAVDQAAFSQLCDGAARLAGDYYSSGDFRRKYNMLLDG